MPVQVRGEVLANRRAGAYHLVSVVAPGIAEQAKPGQFVTVAVGDEPTSMLTRRAFSIYQVRPRGVFGGTVEVVFAVVGAGTAWLAARQPHDVIDLVGPLGRPFSLPKQPATCVLVGGGYGAAPLFPLAEALRARAAAIDVILAPPPRTGSSHLGGQAHVGHPHGHHGRRVGRRPRHGL